MSTDIKPGQVWAWKNDGHKGDRFTITAVDGDLAQYKYGEGVANVYSAPIALLQADATLYGQDVTPAPLDPSKVRKQVHWATDLKRGDVIVSVEAHNAVTVEREEPAPEPEPAWKPGTVGMATLNHLVSDNSSFGMRVMRVEWDGLHGFATQTGRIVEDDSTTYSVSDFVPDAITPDQAAEAIYLNEVGRPWADANEQDRAIYGRAGAAVVRTMLGGAR